MVIALLAFLFAGGVHAPLAAAQASDATRAAAEVLDSSYQRELPPPAEAELDGLRLSPSLFGATTAMALVGLMLVLMLVWFAGSVLSSRVSRAQEEQAAHATPALAVTDLPLPDHAALAAARRFAEAIHVLLLGGLAVVAHRAGASLASSLTGREAVRGLKLAPPQAQDLGALLHQAEICHFGTHQPDQQTYEACVAHFERLTREMP